MTLTGWLVFAATSAASELPHFVGSAICVTCHQEAGRAWQQSHHAQSMQIANAQTVLGDFNNVELNHHGQHTRFSRRGEKFFVRTAGATGKPQDFSIAYTFGVYPLQQYLIALPGGRLQALGVAWDARPKVHGGQRWFHLYGESPPRPGESTHWTGREQNWNFMCASCHSTHVSKNYDSAQDQFRTTWAELNVACEACHGAGSTHVGWAQGKREDRPPGLGLDEHGMAAKSIRFRFSSPSQRIATLQGTPQQAQRANESCLGCHSRRQQLVAESKAGAAFLDQYQPSLIEPGLYHADGQIDGEVFEGGSFVQSAMHRAGVACSNCHEPHSLQLRASGNALCAQCHQPEHYAQTSHHHHAASSDGAQCVSCHMSSKTYMGVHVRHDHSLRIPRPDLSLRYGVPNACNQCHRDQSPSWAVEALRRWGGAAAQAFPAFVGALDSAWNGSAAVRERLQASQNAPSGMARASVLAQLSPQDLAVPVAALTAAARDDDGWVRLGVARALNNFPPDAVLPLGVSLLNDPLRAVRIETARALAGVPKIQLDNNQNTVLQHAIDELIEAERSAADRPESHLNLAAIYLRLGQINAAEQALHTALRLAPDFVPALLNLADWYRTQQRDEKSEPLLRRAVQLAPTEAAPAFALGLLLVRKGKRNEALPWLRQAVQLAPTVTHYRYTLDIAEREATQSTASGVSKSSRDH